MSAIYISTSLLDERMTAAIVTQLTAPLTSIDKTTFLTHAIERAQDLIDSFCDRIYVVPFVSGSIPPLVAEWTYRIVEYELYKRGCDGDVPTKYKNSYDEVIALLKEVAAGSLSIKGASRKSTAGDSMSFDSDTAIFDEESMEYF
jgi:phage gp36-like protein